MPFAAYAHDFLCAASRDKGYMIHSWYITSLNCCQVRIKKLLTLSSIVSQQLSRKQCKQYKCLDQIKMTLSMYQLHYNNDGVLCYIKMQNVFRSTLFFSF